MLNCIVIDDEPLAAGLLADYIGKTGDLLLGGTYTSALEGLKAIQEQQPGLVFLDIQMPELTGLQILKITGSKCRFILTTAYQEYALDGFEHDVVDYLLKPFGYDRFLVAVQKAKERIKTIVPVTEAVAAATNFIFVKTEYRIKKINHADILYMEALRDYVCIYTPHEKVMTLQSLRSFETALPASRFARIHKSYLVALDKIEHIEKNRVVIGQQYIPIGDTYRAAFFKTIGAQP
jgi:two-component system, LytTR family, response regulator